ncbi:hypothetical protein NGRA_0608 [Nosema granulosis]|uniref:Uncharacterized protein n=1 Tax=Nosema granulosis TaxID=83296 RepID=A0A9P6H010_9MICR|nr:hypothetical protein NGRA_0608 [Nosema granulosis]
MSEETYFSSKTEKIEEIIKDKNKQFTRIYMNVRDEQGKDVLYLSRDKGQDLYIVSLKDHKNIEEYFTAKAPSRANAIEKKEFKAENNVKRTKQGSLLSFFKKQSKS